MEENKNLENENENEEVDNPGALFVMHLLFEEECRMPDEKYMTEVFKKHLGEAQCNLYDGEVASFAATGYNVHFEEENVDVPPHLMVTKCIEIQDPIMDDLSRYQLWDCPEGKDILDSCKYHVIATDMMAAGLPYRERADLLVKYAEALCEAYPSCKAVVFANSNKMFTRDAIVNCTVPYDQRFIYYAVNVRFFNIADTEDCIVDTVGMSTLFMPDLQYHYHDLEPADVINHAYNILLYMFDNDNPIKDGDKIDGLLEGEISPEVMWKVAYEDSLLGPDRMVMDINTGIFAAGDRE